MSCSTCSPTFWFASSGGTVRFPQPISVCAFCYNAVSPDRYLVEIVHILICGSWKIHENQDFWLMGGLKSFTDISSPEMNV